MNSLECALLLHGGPSMAVSYLEPLAAELANTLCIESYQQGPHARVADYVTEALEHLPETAWVVGHSWGGYLAMQLAAAAPERVSGLILVCSLGMGGDGGLAEGLAELERRVPGGSDLSERWPGYFAGPAPQYPKGLLLEAEAKDSTHRDLTHTDVSDRLRRFRGPVLAICGGSDFLPRSAMERTLALFPRSRLAVIPDTGHFPWLERPGAVAELLSQFLTDPPNEGAFYDKEMNP